MNCPGELNLLHGIVSSTSKSPVNHRLHSNEKDNKLGLAD